MTFATILFADGKEELMNINCKNVNFLHCIRVKCAEVCRITDQIDVADENGECKFLFRNLDSYTSQYVGEREKLILLRVEDAKPSEKLANNCRFVPLLKSLEEDKEFIVAINPTAGQKSNKTNKVTTKLSVKKAMAAGTNGNSLSASNGSGINSLSPSGSGMSTPSITGGGKRTSISK